MPSAKQIKNQKLFAKRVKRGDFRKAISKTKKSNFDKDYEMVCHTCGKKGDLSKHNKRHKIGSQARSYSVGAEETAKAMGQQLPKTIPKNEIEMVKTENEFYREYKKLGGKKSRAKYKNLLNEFYDHTFEIFTGGEQSRYSTRNEALYGFKKSAKIDWKEVDRIYESVDNIHAYT